MKQKLLTSYTKNVVKLNIKVVALCLALLILAGFSYFAPERSEQVKLTSSYPATVCPAIGNKISSIAALTKSKINRRSIDGTSKRLNPGKSSVIALKDNAILVEGDRVAGQYGEIGVEEEVTESVGNVSGEGVIVFPVFFGEQ